MLCTARDLANVAFLSAAILGHKFSHREMETLIRESSSNLYPATSA